MTGHGHCTLSLQAWNGFPIETRHPVSPTITTRFTTGLGSGKVRPATVADWAPAGSRNSQVFVLNTDGFELTGGGLMMGSVLVGRSGIVPASARMFIGLVTPSTMIAGQPLDGVFSRAIA